MLSRHLGLHAHMRACGNSIIYPVGNTVGAHVSYLFNTNIHQINTALLTLISDKMLQHIAKWSILV